jgi:hypothetical protein
MFDRVQFLFDDVRASSNIHETLRRMDDRLDAHLTELQLLIVDADAKHRALRDLVDKLEEDGTVSHRDLDHLVVFARSTSEAIERVVSAAKQLARDAA